MNRATDILNQTRQLSRDEQRAVFWWLMPEVVFREAQRFDAQEREFLDGVLEKRGAWPFVPLDDDLLDRVVDRGEALLKGQDADAC